MALVFSCSSRSRISSKTSAWFAMLSLTVVGLVGVATATSTSLFFVASFIVGLCSTGAQVLVPFIAHLAPEARRGHTVGNVMFGLLGGIMLARPAALFIAANLGWRAVFWCSAFLMLLIGAALFRLMPRHQPPGGKHYFQILRSMVGLFATCRSCGGAPYIRP